MALQLSAAHGPVQSLERAAAVCDGWVFDRIQESLRIAQMQMHSPWDELRDLADKIGIPELGDVGAIMRSSGSEGAQVHETLRSRADSLRDQIRTDNLARAEGVTSRLDIPGSLLVFVLLGFVVYPFLARSVNPTPQKEHAMHLISLSARRADDAPGRAAPRRRARRQPGADRCDHLRPGRRRDGGHRPGPEPRPTTG